MVQSWHTEKGSAQKTIGCKVGKHAEGVPKMIIYTILSQIHIE